MDNIHIKSHVLSVSQFSLLPLLVTQLPDDRTVNSQLPGLLQQQNPSVWKTHFANTEWFFFSEAS